MIKILIVLEEEDGMDFRAYALQISNRSKDSPPQVKLHSIENNSAPRDDVAINRPSSHPGGDGNNRSLMHQIGRPLETRQIFMN
jgi:hypothetical protein